MLTRLSLSMLLVVMAAACAPSLAPETTPSAESAGSIGATRTLVIVGGRSPESLVAKREVPIFPLYYNLELFTHVANLGGPHITVSSDTATWNMHQWHWTR